MATNGHGGKRPGAGRPKGSRNRATLAREAGLGGAVEAARAHVECAFATLAEVMADDTAPAAARVKAAGMLLDRAYGRAPAVNPVSAVRTLAERERAELEELEAGGLESHLRPLGGGLSPYEESRREALRERLGTG